MDSKSMFKHASRVRARLHIALTPDPGRFAGGAAWFEPLSLLAIERERLAALDRQKKRPVQQLDGSIELLEGGTLPDQCS